ncbi:MAG: YdbH domain-containing protein [Opitutaceae bacterium]|nr:YdbH domain-containing protein [Opitutaceae bacterium]
MSGSFSGTLVWAGCPPVVWTCEATPAEAGRLQARVGLEGKGLLARAVLRYEPGTALATWTLEEAEIDLGVWFKPLLARLAPTWRDDDLQVRGRLLARSRGVRSDEGLSGTVALQWLDGAMDSASRSIDVTGIELRLQIDDLARPASPRGQSLQFARAGVAGVEIKNGKCDFQIENGNRVRVASAVVETLGGRLSADPFSFTVSDQGVSSIKAQISAKEVALAEVALFLPKVILEAHGKVSGGLGISWDPQTGIALGVGSLRLDRLDAVEIRLFPQPGFLTDRVPETLSLLPAWTGALGRLLTVTNPARQVLRAIEMGELPLVVDELELRTQPNGDDLGRTARVAMSARPKVPGVVESVSFEVNVSGPLDQVLRIGMENSISSITNK